MPAPTPAPAAARRAAPGRPPPGRPPARAPDTTYTLRLGPEAVTVPAVRGEDGSLRGDLTAYGIRRGGVLLTDLLVDPAGGWAAGPVEAPFVRGTARVALDAEGRETGHVALEAAVRVLGTTLASVAYAEDGWAGAPLPVPSVAVDGVEARVAVDAAAVRGALTLDTGTGAHAVAGVALRVPLGDGAALPDVSGSVGTPLDATAEQRLADLLAQPVPGVVVHTDAPASAAAEAAGVRGLAIGRHLYFDRGAYDPATAAGLDLLARLVGQALAGIAGPATTPPDPAAADVVSQPATAFTPPAPAAEVPAAPGGEVPAEPAAEAAPGADTAPAVDAPAAEGGGPAPAPTPAGAAPVAEVELIVPPAPTEPGPAQQQRQAAVGGGAGGAARAAATVPPAAESTGDARAAVTPPDAEGQARAEAELADALGRRPEPNPALVTLCDQIRAAIRAKRPVDEEHLVEAEPREMAREAGSSMSTAVQGDADRVQGSYDALSQQPAPAPTPPGTPVAPTDPAVTAPPIAAERATPDAIPPEDVSLDADRASVDQRIADSRIERTSTEPIQDAPFSTVREGRDELGQMAETSPAQVLAQQDEALGNARADMAALQIRALQALSSSRSSTVAGTSTQQTGMVGSEQQTRESVSRQAQTIFSEAQTQVNALLEPLSRTAMATWTAGVERHSTEFRQALDSVKRWIDERHSGVGGAIVAGWDALTGLPGWVVESYDRAERQFGDHICDLLLEISADVESVIAAAQTVIEDARRRINELFASLPAELQAWAAEQQAQFASRLDGLSNRVTTARDDFNRDIAQRAVAAVAAVQHEVEGLRDAARGLIGRVVAAIDAFLEDPVKAIIDGLLTIVGIPPAAFWALIGRIQQVASDIAEDPMRFVNNLVAALRQGFEQFFANFPQHLLQGFFDWLFSGLGSVGVQIPADTSLPSLVTFALQLMGITWPRVREILVRHVGAQNVALIEQIWQFVSVLIQRGPAGIFEMLRERLDPAAFVQQIIDAAIEYVVQTLIEQVAMRVVALFNPAGAVLQAMEIAYRVLKWVFENAARIFRFVETVVNGMADIIAGNTAGTAAAIESALASLLPPVIDFLAGFLGLGDLPLRVADVIKGLQEYVYGVMDAAIGWLVERGRALLEALGLGGGQDGAAGGDRELGESVPFAGGDESHRLWIDRNGDTAVVMVSSQPKPVRDQVVAWSAKLTEPNGVAADKRDRARTLLADARAKLGILDDHVRELAPAFNAAEHGAPPAPAAAAPAPGTAATAGAPDDTAVEAQEHALVPVLGELFGIFEADRRTWALCEIRTHLPNKTGPFVTEAHGYWDTTYIKDWKYTKGRNPTDGSPIEEPLWTGVLPGTESLALPEANAADAHESLLPFFVGTDRAGAHTAEFATYAFSPANPFRSRFIAKLGQPVPDKLRTVAQPKINALTDPDYKTEWTTKLGNITFEPGVAPYGRVSIPAERVPDHTNFKPVGTPVPQDDVPAVGTRTTTYRTVSGQTFTVREPMMPGLSVQVEGRNLQIMPGRGVTQDSPNFIPGQNMNRAHIIANNFTGSGYKESGNLATTSAQYNQVEMAHRERAIVAEARAYADLHCRDVADVRFTMTVNVRFGALLDQTILAEIEKQPWFKGGQTASQAILANLASAATSPLRRVVAVDYAYEFSFPGTTCPPYSNTKDIGPDLWLLINWKGP